MFLSEIHANGFRCFAPGSPLTLKLHRGLNILVGPNDAGKTAIVDAPRYVLWTRGDDYVRLEPGDFHVSQGGERCSELLVRCTFDDLTANEQARFLEWCTNEQGQMRLHVCLRGVRRPMPGGGDNVFTQYRAGRDADGIPLEGELREHLRATYLRPLRDAERELRPGRRSRLSRILGAIPHMAVQSKQAEEGQPPTLSDTMKEAETAVDANPAVQKVQGSVNTDYLKHLSFSNDLLSATLGLGAKGSFEQILERLELYLDSSVGLNQRISRGLGYNNLLFMAAELLLLQSHSEQLPLLLIEEAEAHLHPQHQTLFMGLLEEKTNKSESGESQQVQVLQTTHSPHLAASADLQAMTMIVGHRAYPLDKANTKLEKDDYEFLRRFLNSTKANLFFARGLLIVEGDAENLLLPAIAQKLDKSLGKNGTSIVNVGHRGLFRYSRILQRADGSTMPVPVSLIPDRDVPPNDAKTLVGNRRTEGEFSAEDLAEHVASLRKHDGGSVKSFPSEQWTLEFDLARKLGLAHLVHQACKLAKGRTGKTHEEIEGIKAAAEAEVQGWRDAGQSADQIAVAIYTPLYKNNVSKAEVAEQLAKLIDELADDAATFRGKVPGYLADAIDYATSFSAATPTAGEQAAAAR